MKHVKLTQSAKVLSSFSALHSWWCKNCTTNLVVFTEEIIKNLWVLTGETIATLEWKDEDVCWGFRPENRWWVGICAVNEIKLNHVLAVFTGLKVTWAIQIFPCISGLVFLTKVLLYEPVILQIKAMKFRFCGNRIFHWLLHFFPSFKNQFWLFVIVKTNWRQLFMHLSSYWW